MKDYVHDKTGGMTQRLRAALLLLSSPDPHHAADRTLVQQMISATLDDLNEVRETLNAEKAAL